MQSLVVVPAHTPTPVPLTRFARKLHYPPHKGEGAAVNCAQPQQRAPLPPLDGEGSGARSDSDVAELGWGDSNLRARQTQPTPTVTPATNSIPWQKFRPDLSPLLQPMRHSPRPAHRSEIMTSGWCGGGRVVRESSRARPKVPRHGPVRRSSRCHARAARCGAVRGARPPRMRRPGKVGNAGSPGLPGRPRSSRCGTGCSRASVP